MPLLDEDDFPEVRAAMGLQPNEPAFPNTRIALDVFKGRAESWVAARTVDTGEHARLAAVFKTAALLVSSFPAEVSVIYAANGQREASLESSREKAAHLSKQAEEELTLTSDSGSKDTSDDLTANVPTMFTLISGARGY